VFALDGDTLYSAVDEKPKRSRTLRRIENARVRPDVTVLVDHYEEDWQRLWWIRLRGQARVLDRGDERDRALALLTEKYPQYADAPPHGPRARDHDHRNSHLDRNLSRSPSARRPSGSHSTGMCVTCAPFAPADTRHP
jgi:PPOX class probable F420-dependent enzyme